MAGLFVLARSAVTFANSASYPFCPLGGILVPVSPLPGFLQPLSNVVFLSWSATLLRASLSPQPLPRPRLGLAMILGLGCLALALQR